MAKERSAHALIYEAQQSLSCWYEHHYMHYMSVGNILFVLYIIMVSLFDGLFPYLDMVRGQLIGMTSIAHKHSHTHYLTTPRT